MIEQAGVEALRDALLQAAAKCSDRCLYQSAKWAAETAQSLTSSIDEDITPSDHDSLMQDADPTGSRSTNLLASADAEQARMERAEMSKYILAKSYFDCREFDRCAAVFLPLHSTLETSNGIGQSTPSRKKGKSSNSTAAASQSDIPHISQKALFLSLYARYMAGEKRKDEETEMVLGPVDAGIAVNTELTGICNLLELWFAHRSSQGLDPSNDGWLEYLYGIVLAKAKSEDFAKQWLIKSIHRAPFNWSAWQELQNLLHSTEDLERLMPDLPQNVMTFFFHVFASQELYQATEQVHQVLDELQQLFPSSRFLQTQRALLYYHAKDFEEAEQLFSNILTAEPHRIDSLDHYSNILYVMSDRPKLAYLAQIAIVTDKFRPETCCIVGNYYSLKSEHEKAVMYFRRALMLDRTFLSAWTLMGHEYVEMKNTHAAIESYRRAVDMNRKDYRAWYGLGQTYEILEMHYYALFYFQRAASLRPHDAKMWQAVGQCYDKIERPVESIKAYKRALVAGAHYDTNVATNAAAMSDRERLSQGHMGTRVLDPDILYQIALMYERLDDLEQAVTFMELTVAQEEGTPVSNHDPNISTTSPNIASASKTTNDATERSGGTGVTNTTSRARMWLAKWEAKRGDWSRALDLANELYQDGVEVEEAKALMRDMRARMDARD